MESHEGHAQRLLSDLGQKIDALTAKIKDKAKEKGIEVDAEVEKLKKERDKLEREFQEFKTRNEPRWKQMFEHLENAGQEILKAGEALFKKHS
jgi:hypothetical protein